MKRGIEYLALFIVVFLWGSCKTKEKVTDYPMPENINREMVIQSVLDNQLGYNTLYFKRMMVEISENGKSKAVRANMYIKKDSTIVISIIPLMGIEVMRISLDSSSIRVVDRLNRKIITSSYNYVTDNYGVVVNYKIVESLLTNSLFSYPEGTDVFLSKYSGSKHDSYFSIKSIDDKRYERLLKRNSDVYLHEVKILPDSYKIQSNSLINISGGINMNVIYSSFVKQGSFNFPENISIDVKHKDKIYNLTLSYKELEIDGTNSLNFRLPDKYEVTVY